MTPSVLGVQSSSEYIPSYLRKKGDRVSGPRKVSFCPSSHCLQRNLCRLIQQGRFVSIFESIIEIKLISASMSSNTKTRKDGSKVSFEQSASKRSKDQLQPPYPMTLKLAETLEDGDKGSKTKASPQQHTGGIGRSSSEESAVRQPAAYLSVERPWGRTSSGNGRSSGVGYSPMSKWEHGAILDEPWNGVGEVAAGANTGGPSTRRSQCENRRWEKDSDCATKGSSKAAS